MTVVLRVAQRIGRTESEGPGARYAIWVQGCSIRCPGCCNPEMFSDRGGEIVPVASIVSEIAAHPQLEGISVLGGEPFEQAGAVAELARQVRRAGLSVMVFTGHVREELEGRGDEGVEALLANVDLLADGPFVAERPGSRFRWLGSQNQRLHVLSSRYRDDDPRFYAPNTVEIRIDRNRVEVSGWAPAAMSLVEPAGLIALRRRRC